MKKSVTPHAEVVTEGARIFGAPDTGKKGGCLPGRLLPSAGSSSPAAPRRPEQPCLPGCDLPSGQDSLGDAVLPPVIGVDDAQALHGRGDV